MGDLSNYDKEKLAAPVKAIEVKNIFVTMISLFGLFHAELSVVNDSSFDQFDPLPSPRLELKPCQDK